MSKSEMIRISGRGDAQLRVVPESEGGTGRTIEGYAIVFGRESVPLWTEMNKPCREVISPEAITADLLDRSDIKMTLYHDMGRLLARSKQGKGSLSYTVDDHGVKFRFDAPRTAYGDDAVEQVRLGNIDGCSFMFATDYRNGKSVERVDHDDRVVYTVSKIEALYDFTLTPDPAYPQTECSLRSAAAAQEPEPEPVTDLSQVEEMKKVINYLTL